MGELLYSGPNPGLDREAKLAIISAKHERFSGESSEGVLESRSGLIVGDFLSVEWISGFTLGGEEALYLDIG
jgi:hypothetical protein